MILSEYEYDNLYSQIQIELSSKKFQLSLRDIVKAFQYSGVNINNTLIDNLIKAGNPSYNLYTFINFNNSPVSYQLQNANQVINQPFITFSVNDLINIEYTPSYFNTMVVCDNKPSSINNKVVKIYLQDDVYIVETPIDVVEFETLAGLEKFMKNEQYIGIWIGEPNQMPQYTTFEWADDVE